MVWAACISGVMPRSSVRMSLSYFSFTPPVISVAITPGRDFGSHDMHRYVRFSTASSMAQLQEAAARLKALLA